MRALKFTEKEIETILYALGDEQRESGIKPQWVRFRKVEHGTLEVEYSQTPEEEALGTHFPEYLP